MNTKLLARTVVYDEDNDAILLVRNKGADYWYIPGGGWEYEHESMMECAVREVKEETGLDVEIVKFLYQREYHHSSEIIFFESFWLATAKSSTVLDKDHTDKDPEGNVGEARWFNQKELGGIILYPEVFKDRFWKNLQNILSEDDRFLQA